MDHLCSSGLDAKGNAAGRLKRTRRRGNRLPPLASPARAGGNRTMKRVRVFHPSFDDISPYAIFSSSKAAPCDARVRLQPRPLLSKLVHSSSIALRCTTTKLPSGCRRAASRCTRFDSTVNSISTSNCAECGTMLPCGCSTDRGRRLGPSPADWRECRPAFTSKSTLTKRRKTTVQSFPSRAFRPNLPLSRSSRPNGIAATGRAFAGTLGKPAGRVSDSPLSIGVGTATPAGETFRATRRADPGCDGYDATVFR